MKETWAEILKLHESNPFQKSHQPKNTWIWDNSTTLSTPNFPAPEQTFFQGILSSWRDPGRHYHCTASLQQKLGLLYIHPYLEQQQIKWLTNCKHNKSCSWEQLRNCVLNPCKYALLPVLKSSMKWTKAISTYAHNFISRPIPLWNIFEINAETDEASWAKKKASKQEWKKQCTVSLELRMMVSWKLHGSIHCIADGYGVVQQSNRC